jgi:hypothetical protein
MSHIPHPFGIAGVMANMAGALALLYFPPKVVEYTRDGRRVVQWVGRGSDEGRRTFQIRRDGFQLGIGLLFLGFFLQLLDILTS